MRSKAGKQENIRAIFGTLYRRWGRQHWWPAETPFEVVVGAYLTQNTAWTNVERALTQLRQAGALRVEGIRAIDVSELEKLIRSAGYFRQKAARLKQFVTFLDLRYGGSLERMFSTPTEHLREELLALNGIGPETADSILLYAGQHPIFVVDAYTRRILERHGLAKVSTKYEEIRALVEGALADPSLPELAEIDPAVLPKGSCHAPSSMSTATRCDQAQVFNEMHGLIVGVGKNYCLKSKPKCEACPLGPLLPKRKFRIGLKTNSGGMSQ
jgi:endonuclease III related protein